MNSSLFMVAAPLPPSLEEPPVERVIPVCAAYIDASPSSHDFASASEARRLAGSLVSAKRSTASAREVPMPQDFDRCPLMAETPNPPGILPLTRRETNPDVYFP